MKRFTVFSGCRQFYVADAELASDAPEEWTDAHVQQRQNTLQHIAALCLGGDISARVICCGPGDTYPEMPDPAEFEVQTEIEVASGRIGVYGWPWELRGRVFNCAGNLYDPVSRVCTRGRGFRARLLWC